jgi:hypothetical protein
MRIAGQSANKCTRQLNILNTNVTIPPDVMRLRSDGTHLPFNVFGVSTSSTTVAVVGLLEALLGERYALVEESSVVWLIGLTHDIGWTGSVDPFVNRRQHMEVLPVLHC